MKIIPDIPIKFERFPDGYVNDINGWAFDRATIEQNKGKLLTLDIDLSQQSSQSSLQGYSGGNLCFAILPDETTGSCTNASGGYFISSYVYNGPLQQETGDPDLTSGTLSTGTPEPSSFLLLSAPALWFGIRRMKRRA